MQAIKWSTLLFGAIFVVVVAGAINAPHLYYMAAILLTLPGISYLLGFYSLRSLQFRREPPTVAWAGEQGELLYVVENPTRVPRYFISCREPLPDWIEPQSEHPPIFNVSPQATSKIVYAVRFARRGVHTLTAFESIAIDPLGVFAFGQSHPAEGEIVVYPMPEQLKSWKMSGADKYGWQEFTVIALRGSSVDPDGVRQYVPGDPLRRIHWRQTARTGNLSVIEFEDPQSIQVQLILDRQKGHNFGSEAETTFEYAVRFCASITYQMVQQNASVRLSNTLDTTNETAVNARGEMQLMRILDTLARVEDDTTEPISEVVNRKAGEVPRGTTLIIVTSNPDARLGEALLLHKAQSVLCIVVYIAPNTFEENRVSSEQEQLFYQAVSSGGAKVFAVRLQTDGTLFPEGVSDGNF